MEHPRSPHMPSSTKLAGAFGTTPSSLDAFRAPFPPHIQDSVSSISPRLSVGIPHIPSVTHESSSSQSQRLPSAVMKLEEPESMQWSLQPFSLDSPALNTADYQIHVPYAASSGVFYNYAQNGMSYNDNNNLAYASQNLSPSCPRTYPGLDHTGFPNDVSMSDSYPPAAYQIEPQRHHNLTPLSDPSMNDRLMQLRDNHEQHYGSYMNFLDASGYSSPYSDTTRASTPNNDPARYQHDPAPPDDTTIDKEQPYAQLIYQALLQADGHTMILRDIYDWFVKYTDKAAASETKGWQNSIRHNLSMNGAFEKVDQPHEESRKGFMWRLTPEALREGVKSTTRYRSKVPNKRGHRTQPPQPQRQASGAKGGQAARRNAHLKRAKQRSGPYVARSVPAAFEAGYGMRRCFAEEGMWGAMGIGVDAMRMSMPSDTYVLSQGPEPLFTNSPTPEAEEPRTPVGDGWKGDALGCGFEEVGGYQEYSG